MKLILLLVISSLALHNGEGAPRRALYKFVRCNPSDGQANCVTYQTPEMPWNPDLPSKLPASTAQYLEAEKEEGESPLKEEDEDYAVDMEAKEMPVKSEDGESPVIFPGDEGSADYEGSATENYDYFADIATAAETGSGESWTPEEGGMNAWRKLFPNSPFTGEPKPTEKDLKEDHLLKL